MPELSTLAALVRASRLDARALNSSAVRWTLFAPHNAGARVRLSAPLSAPPTRALTPHHVAAFEAAESALGVDRDGLLRAAASASGALLLETHLVKTALTAGTLLAARAVNASSGVPLAVGGDLASGLRLEAPGSSAAVVVPNVRAGKAVLHVLDGAASLSHDATAAWHVRC